MKDEVTRLLPKATEHAFRPKVGWAWRADLLGGVHSRVRLLALLLAFAFAFDPVIHSIVWLYTWMMQQPVPPTMRSLWRLDVLSSGACMLSLVLWWAAHHRRLASTYLVTLSLIYEVMMCFVVSVLSMWHIHLDTGVVPRITWIIGIIIIFPLVVPAPPKRILLAALASALTPAPALWLLNQMGLVEVAPGYLQIVINPLLAAAFAFFGAHVVYDLGRKADAFRELGSYRLERKLGEGGMGEIWRAQHRLLARPAAIKLIRPELAACQPTGSDGEVLDRFEREAQVIASLRSPHTVTLFDFGVSTEGVFYYVMELLDGLDAQELVRRHGPQPVGRVLYLLTQICHSLSEAESRHVVHRDIKPANIFLCHYGEEYDFVKVLDFGLAKTFKPAQPTVDTITTDNSLHGTPAYMAPEQIQGEPVIDTRADIYALGCVAYWLLTGHTVFSTPNAVGQLVAHSSQSPEPPSAKAPGFIPEALDQLVLDCLAKDPDARPQTVRLLQQRLAALNHGAWTQRDAREWWTHQA